MTLFVNYLHSFVKKIWKNSKLIVEQTLIRTSISVFKCHHFCVKLTLSI